MLRSRFIAALAIAGLLLSQAPVAAQEFPIATGSDSTFGQGGASDGAHYLIGLVTSSNDLSAQFVGEGGALYGSRFSLGAKGSGLTIAFDGTNYLAVWTDPFPFFAGGDTNGIGDIHGQFISPAGSLVGSPFTIVTGTNIKFGQGRGGLVFEDTNYLLFYEKGGQHQDYLYAQLISTSGSLVGGPVQVSSNYARETAIGFDGTNFLVAWVEGSGVDEFIYGQRLTTQAAPVGSNFLIDGSPLKSDDPVSMAFDGSRYFVVFHEQAANDTGWNLIGRFVTPAGVVAPNRIMVCDSSKNPVAPMLAFDGTNYLVTWIQTAGGMRVKGRYFCSTGVPVDPAFTLFDTLGGKMPFGGVSGFANGRYILGATRVDGNITAGDVYGKLLDPLTAGGNPLLGTWTKTSGPANALKYYFNSNSVTTVVLDTDTSMTAGYSVDTSVTPHRISWHVNGKLANLGIWDTYGDNLFVKGSGGDTTTFPTTSAPELRYDASASGYARANVTTSVEENPRRVVREFSLMQNYPNPFNPSTKISYRLKAAANVFLAVYDLLGRNVATLVNERQTAGDHLVTFNAGDLSSGIYFYRLTAGSSVETRKLLLVR